MRARAVMHGLVLSLPLLGCAEPEQDLEDPRGTGIEAVPYTLGLGESIAPVGRQQTAPGEGAPAEGATQAQTWRLSERPTATVGSGSPEQELYRVRQARRLSDGRIVVANDGTLELRFFDESGRHLMSAGREGDGPGEFRSLSWMGVTPQDSIVTFDLGTGRVSIFDPNGRFVHSVRMPGHMQVVGRDLTVRTPRGVFGDGSLLVDERIASGGGAPSENTGVTIDSLKFIRFDPRTESIVDLGRFPEAPSFSLRGGASMGLPLGPRPVLLAEGGGLYFGSGEDPAVEVYTMSGEHQRSVRWNQDLREVSRADIDAEVTRLRDPETVNEGRRALTAPLLEAMQWPQHHPAYSEVLVDPQDNVWARVGEAEDGSASWTVVSPEGQIIATVETPFGLDVEQVGVDYVLGIRRDEFGVEMVEVYGVTKE